jgi:hypothetical protein
MGNMVLMHGGTHYSRGGENQRAGVVPNSGKYHTLNIREHPTKGWRHMLSVFPQSPLFFCTWELYQIVLASSRSRLFAAPKVVTNGKKKSEINRFE